MMQRWPIDHLVIDDFLPEEKAQLLLEEFPDYNDPLWFEYNSPLELKRTCNSWEKFPTTTYSFFTQLLDKDYADAIGRLFGLGGVEGDIGLHGGGWHMHGRGGKLNVHKDYSLHPKTGAQRRLNLILYLTPDWQPEWGGGLELWTGEVTGKRPVKCAKVIENKFNRAVIFRTDQNSWHGLPSPIECPEGVYRRSLAAYFVTDPDEGAEQRYRALFAPTKEQEGDSSIEELIKLRQQ